MSSSTRSASASSSPGGLGPASFFPLPRPPLWTKVPIIGDAPTARALHCCNLLSVRAQKLYNQTHADDSEDAHGADSKQQKSTTSPSDFTLFIFGGYDQTQVLSEMYVLQPVYPPHSTFALQAATNLSTCQQAHGSKNNAHIHSFSSATKKSHSIATSDQQEQSQIPSTSNNFSHLSPFILRSNAMGPKTRLERRLGHTSITLQNHVYLFGG